METSLSSEKKNKNRVVIGVSLVIALIVAVLYGIASGSVHFSLTEVYEGLVDKTAESHHIVWYLRVPRVLLGCIVGATLAVAGGIMQGVMRNPLADPNIVGVSSGAGLVGVLILVVYQGFAPYLPIATFLGAFLTAMFVYALSAANVATPNRIILVGISINAMLGAIMSALMLLYSDRVQAVLPWLSGGLGGGSFEQVKMVGIYVIVAFLLCILATKHLKLLSLGDEVSTILGHSVRKSRFFLIFLSAVLSGIAVSIAGLIGFVGLVVPHIMRLLIGKNDDYFLLYSAIGGAALVVFADTIARSWFGAIELPVGILLSFLGGPFFLFLLFKGGEKHAASK